MRNDLRMLAYGAAFIGATSGLVYSATSSHPMAEVQQVRSTQVATAPAAAVVTRQAARAVLDGVGVENGLTTARVQTALGALGGKVSKLSDDNALRMAFQAYYRYEAANPGKVKKPYLYFVDYGLNSRTPRGYVFDMKALKVVDGPFTVAHGRGSVVGGKDVPTRFSNREGSNATSLGLYLAQEMYSFSGKTGGKRYQSRGLRLTGVSGKYNSAARQRGVVVHGAPYVTASRAGRSEGCPAVELKRADKLIPKIANGGMVFLFSPLDEEWQREDRWAGLADGMSGNG
jgi:hypothetical protein